MWIAVALLGGIVIGLILGHTIAILMGSTTLAKHSAIVKEALIERNAAISILSRIKEEIAQLQGNGNKRVVLAEDLSSVRKLAGIPESSRLEPASGLKVVER